MDFQIEMSGKRGNTMDSILFDSFGIQVQIGHWGDDYSIWHHTDHTFISMPKRHRHNSIEVNLVVEGDIGYYMPSGEIRLPCHRLVMFWGSIPHQTSFIRGRTDFYSLHIPLSAFLQWKLPESITRAVMSGGYVVEDNDMMLPADLVYFRKWDVGINQGNPVDLRQANIEICARMHRLATQFSQGRYCRISDEGDKGGQPILVEKMALYISTHFTDPLVIGEIAAHAGLHPKYAMRIFHKQTGITMKNYIIMLRIHQSQFMLLTTDCTVLQIAMDAGFGSSSSFYEAFHRVCNCSPMEYRSRVRV